MVDKVFWLVYKLILKNVVFMFVLHFDKFCATF